MSKGRQPTQEIDSDEDYDELHSQRGREKIDPRLYAARAEEDKIGSAKLTLTSLVACQDMIGMGTASAE
jgi:hypothetical protein